MHMYTHTHIHSIFQASTEFHLFMFCYLKASNCFHGSYYGSYYMWNIDRFAILTCCMVVVEQLCFSQVLSYKMFQSSRQLSFYLKRIESSCLWDLLIYSHTEGLFFPAGQPSSWKILLLKCLCIWPVCPFSTFSIAHFYVLLSTADIFHRWSLLESMRALQYRWPCQQIKGQFILPWLASFWGHLGCYLDISKVIDNSRAHYP